MSKETVNIVSQSEQLEALLISIATVVASYRKKLVEEGVPEQLADALVIEWHRIWWSKSND